MGSHFRQSPEAVAQRVGDEIVLVHLKTDRIFALNGTGARIWELISESCDRAEIQKQLLEEFDVAEAQLEREIRALLEVLQKERFIEAGT